MSCGEEKSLPHLDFGFEHCSLPIVIYDVDGCSIVCANKVARGLKVRKLDLRESLHKDSLEGQEARGIVISEKIEKDQQFKEESGQGHPEFCLDDFPTAGKHHLNYYTVGAPDEKMQIPATMRVLRSAEYYRDFGGDFLMLELNLPPYSTGKEGDCFNDHMCDGFWDWYPQCDYEYLSPGFWKMFGYDPSEMPHNPSAWQSIMHKDDLDESLSVFDEHVKSHGKKKFLHKMRFKHKKGHCVTVLCRATVVEWLPNTEIPWRVVGTHTGITETLWMQSAKVREKLISQLSHDLKTPLCVLISVCEKQFKGFSNTGGCGNPSDYKKASEIWESERSCFEMALQHLVELTNDLQFFADQHHRMMGNIPTTKKEVVNLHALFLCTCRCIQLYADMSNTSILMSVDTENVPKFVYVDKRAISRLMYNLGSNAVRHGPRVPSDANAAPTPIQMHLSLATKTAEDSENNSDDGSDLDANSSEQEKKNPPETVYVNMVVSNSTSGLNSSAMKKLKEQFSDWESLKFSEDKNIGIAVGESGTLGMSIVYSLLSGMNGKLKFSLDKEEGVKWLCSVPVEIVHGNDSLEETLSSRPHLGIIEDYITKQDERDDESKLMATPNKDICTSFEGEGEETTMSVTQSGCSSSLDDYQSDSTATVCEEETKGCVLVVEDEPIVARLVSMWVANDNWECVMASNGVEAIDIVYKNDAKTFDFVLLDLHMPDMNGFGFLERLKDKGYPRSLRDSLIVVTSAYITESNWEKLQGLGAFDRFDKPYRYNRLQTYLSSILKSSGSTPKFGSSKLE